MKKLSRLWRSTAVIFVLSEASLLIIETGSVFHLVQPELWPTLCFHPYCLPHELFQFNEPSLS